MKNKYQQKYIEKKKALGLCFCCGRRKSFKAGRCRKCYDKLIEYQRAYQAAHRKEQRKRCAAFRRKNPDYYKKWYAENIKQK